LHSIFAWVISLDRDELDVDFGTELHYDKDKSNYEEYYDDKFDHQVVWRHIFTIKG
jgi:flavin-dependent dehydrogenase